MLYSCSHSSMVVYVIRSDLLCILEILFAVVIISGITNAQRCSSGHDIELSVDGQLFTITLYKPIGSSFTVRCRRCNNNRRPSWFNSSRSEISTSCGSGVSICTKNGGEHSDKDLIFSFFEESFEGEYRCTRSSQDGIIDIKILLG